MSDRAAAQKPTSSPDEPYLRDSRFQKALRHMQKGEWEAGLADLTRLLDHYPLAAGLHELRQEARLRAQVDQDELDDRRSRAFRRLITWTIRLVIVGAVIGLGYYGAQTYSVWLQEQMIVAQRTLERQLQEADLTTKLGEARVLLRAGRPDEAKVKLAEIQEVDPNFPGLAAALTEAEAATSLEVQYRQALDLIDQNEWSAALAALEALAEEEPGYKDVELQIAYIERQTLLQEMVVEAEASFAAQDWLTAATAFEAIRALDVTYRQAHIEERLFTSYVNSARLALVDKSDSLEALQIAEGYFRKALALRPQEPEIKTERQLAGLYLAAQKDFSSGHWSDVIAGLELLMAEDPDYALGTAQQTLYEAYVARGDSKMATHDYESALDDFKKALALARQDTDAILRLYEANLRAGEAQAAQTNYETAVQYYRTAVELGRLRLRAQENPAMLAALQEADDLAAQGRYSLALERYKRVVNSADATQATITHVVQPGEYLTLLASRYRSTVRAIVLANDILNPNRIFVGQELVVPVLP